jgi:hypothetical protein
MVAIHRRARAVVYAGFALLTLPVVSQYLWIKEFNAHDSQEERVAAFLSHFPEFLRSPGVLGIWEIATAFVAGAVLAVGAGTGEGPRTRWVATAGAITAIVLAFLLTFLRLFQLL